MRIADSREDVDVLTEVLEGEYPPDWKERLGAWAVALLFLGIVVWSAWESPSDGWSPVLIAIGIIVVLGILWEGSPSYSITRQEFVRKTWLAASSWRVPVADVYAIDLDISGDAISLILVLNDDRKRKLHLRKEGKEKLARLYPVLSDEEPDYAAMAPHDRESVERFQTRLLRISLTIVVISACILAADLATAGHRTLSRLAELIIGIATSLAVGGIAIGAIGIAQAWFHRRQARLAKMPGRWILYGILAAAVIATAVLLWIFASKGLITWS